DRRPIKRALVSVYDKTGLVGIGLALSGAGVEIVSTGSTARTLAEAGVPVTQVEELTGFPECLDGRVKTLHPKLYAGLLAAQPMGFYSPQSLVADARRHGITVLRPDVQASGVLAGLERLHDLGHPVLVAASRKRFLGDLLADADGRLRPPEGRDDATTATSALAATTGARCIRSHTVRATRD
ncbi:MAG: dihydropteroate synthase, partial [Gammaproteobacteria bacterium]